MNQLTDGTPTDRPATHIIQFNRSADDEVLYRKSDGMCIAARISPRDQKGNPAGPSDAVRVGEEPKEAATRVFITPTDASRYLRSVARMKFVTFRESFSITAPVPDPDAPEPVFEMQDTESLLYVPGLFRTGKKALAN